MIPPTYATCPRCERVMAPGTSCCECPWRQDGRVIPATLYGSEMPPLQGDYCRDCNAGRGQSHHYDCCIEQCPHGEQAVTCDLCPVLEHDPYYAAGPVQ